MTNQIRIILFAIVLPLVLPAAGRPIRIANDVLSLGRLAHPALTESSGLIASRRYPGIFWSHNDSATPYLFAIGADGRSVRALPVAGANLIDWEDIAMDEAGNLYLADIGISGMIRTHVAVHMMPEPSPFRIAPAVVQRTWYLRFPGVRPDCEAFFVWRGYGYLISKERLNDTVRLFRFPLSSRARSIPLQFVAFVPVEGDVTAADITRDGSRLGILTENGVQVSFIFGNIASVSVAPQEFTPFVNTFMEAGCFWPNRGFLVTAETRPIWLFDNPAFR